MIFRISCLLLCFLPGLSACATPDTSSKGPTPQAWASTELHPNDQRWYSSPWPESDISHTLSPIKVNAVTAFNAPVFTLQPEKRFQTILGIGASLEHSTVYAIRKNKSKAQQRALLSALIDPVNGIGMNLFRISIGTSDFSDGTRAKTPTSHSNGWYSLQDSPDRPFSIQRNRELGIIDTLNMALEVGAASNNPVRFVASPWSPPAWMREHNSMVQGGTLLPEFYAAYAQYLRNFIEAYADEGIPVYAITLQNERQFEPPAYPGMVLSWQQERDLLIAVYENFHNIGGEYGKDLPVKIWTLDHNFDYWQQAIEQLDSFTEIGKAHYVDGTAFHHYDGDSSAMVAVHAAYPSKDVIFSEGSVWGAGNDNPNRGYQAIIRHLRHWSTAYLSWVTMLPQQVDEANKGPYNKLGVVGPTMIIQEKGSSTNWYKTPEYWLMGQFSRFIREGATRIEVTPETVNRIEAVAFTNPNGSTVSVLSNPHDQEQVITIGANKTYWQLTLPANSIVTVKW